MHTSLIKLCVGNRNQSCIRNLYAFGFLFFGRKKVVLLARRILHFRISISRKVELEIGFCTCKQDLLHTRTQPIHHAKFVRYPRFDRKNAILGHCNTYFHLCGSSGLSWWKMAVFWANTVEYHLNRQWSSLQFVHVCTVFSNEREKSDARCIFNEFPSRIHCCIHLTVQQ